MYIQIRQKKLDKNGQNLTPKKAHKIVKKKSKNFNNRPLYNPHYRPLYQYTPPLLDNLYKLIRQKIVLYDF